VGGGVCALMLASELNTSKFSVSVYERNNALGRKFLVAGDGGLNLTHSENKESFIKRYTPGDFLEAAFNYFSNKDLVKWINGLGIETYVGSSGRVFPKKGIKPAEVLNAILRKIKSNSATIHYKHTWRGFSAVNDLIFENNGELKELKSDIVIFCLGGGSWSVTGSKGEWTGSFMEKGVRVLPFEPSNCALKIDWDKSLRIKIEGKALKNIVITCGGKRHAGEVVLTKFGIEGSGIYPLSPQIRSGLRETGKAEIVIDLKPQFSETKIRELLKEKTRGISEALKNELGFNTLHIQLIKAFVSKEDFLDPAKLAFHLKNLQLTITGMAPVDEAISTVGGISLQEVNSNFELRKMSRHFVIGEMLDYDAPTGGYLLQSCFSMANYLAGHLNKN
jgi:uncharacterized flavoprotein (TIGR03862 family)